MSMIKYAARAKWHTVLVNDGENVNVAGHISHVISDGYESLQSLLRHLVNAYVINTIKAASALDYDYEVTILHWTDFFLANHDDQGFIFLVYLRARSACHRNYFKNRTSVQEKKLEISPEMMIPILIKKLSETQKQKQQPLRLKSCCGICEEFTTVAEFHHCMNDVVVEDGYRTKAGPISPPAVQSSVKGPTGLMYTLFGPMPIDRFIGEVQKIAGLGDQALNTNVDQLHS